MVQLYVSHLRRLLDGDGAEIVTHGRGYELRLRRRRRRRRALRAPARRGARPREALALWRGERAGRPRRRAVRGGRDPPARGAAAARDASWRSTPTSRPAGTREVIGELDALVAEHPLREQLHAQRMLALYRCGPPGRGARGLPRRARSAGRADRRRAWRRAAAPARRDPRPGPGARPARGSAAHAGQATAARPPPHRRTGALVAAAAVLLLAGVAAFGIIRVLEPDGLPGIDENYVGLIDPDGGHITTQYRGRPGARAPWSPAAGRSGSPTRWRRHRLAHRPRARSGGDHRRRRSSSRPGVRRADRSGSPTATRAASRRSTRAPNKVLQRIDVGNAPERRGLRRRRAVGRLGGRRDARRGSSSAAAA